MRSRAHELDQLSDATVPVARRLATPEVGDRSTASVSELQVTAGNQAVGALLLQRHPAGASPTIDPAAAVAEQQAAETSPAVAPAPEGPDGGTTSPDATATPDAGAAPPAPAHPAYLEIAAAQAALQHSYGSVHAITPGNIQFLDTAAAAWVKYDELCVAGHVANPRTHHPWQAGDAQALYPLGLNGFNWQGTSYINRASALSTTTPHEMLHGNAAPDFRGAMGDPLNEGFTQMLAVRALLDAGIAPPNSIPYAEEMRVAQTLTNVAGEAAAESAYFNGGGAITALTGAVDAALGMATFVRVKAACNAGNFAFAVHLLEDPSTGDYDPAAADGTAAA